MVGIQLIGWGNVSNEVSVHQVWLANFNEGIVSLQTPAFSSLARLPIFSPIFSVILVAIVIILLYLYKTSELMNKKNLLIMLAVVIAVALAVNLFSYHQNRGSAAKFRLALIPIQTDSTASRFAWLGDALWHTTARQLRRSVLDQGIIAPTEWTQTYIKRDSLHRRDYLKKLTKQLQLEYFLSGMIAANEKSLSLTYEMTDARSGEKVILRSLTLSAQDLPQVAVTLRDEILNYFHITPKPQEDNIRYIEPEVYQRYLAAVARFQQKHYQLALELAQEVIQADSGNAEALLLLGKSYFMKAVQKKKQGDSPVEELERAREWLNRAVASDSTLAEAYNFLGEYYIYRERWSLAEQMLAKALRLNPNDPRLYLSLSRLHKSRYQKLGFQNEERLFQRAILINPGDEDAHLMLADYLLFENRRREAIEVLEKFLQLNPDSVPALMALGKIYLVRNDILKIINIFNRVLELEPNNSDAYYNLGILYYNSNDSENAEKFLKRAIAIDNHLNAHLYLAYLYEARGDLEQAIEQLRLRIRYRKGLGDEFAEEARKHLFELLHRDSTQTEATIE